MDLTRRQFATYSISSILGNILYFNQQEIKQAAENTQVYQGVPDNYLEHGFLEYLLEDYEHQNISNLKPGEMNIFLDLMTFESSEFDYNALDDVQKDYEMNNVNLAYAERNNELQDKLHEKLKEDYRNFVGTDSWFDILGITGGLIENRTPRPLDNAAIQVLKIPDDWINDPNSENSDKSSENSKNKYGGYGTNTGRIVLGKAPGYQRKKLYKHELGHSLGLQHNENTVMNHELEGGDNHSKKEWEIIRNRLS